MKIALTFICALPFFLAAQRNIHPVNTAEAFAKGIEFHDKGEYAQALEEYEKISINDTNYANARYEMALSNHSLKEYDKAIVILNELLDYKINYNFKYQVYLELGNVYDDKGESEKALEYFTKGLELYPYQHNLLYNRGLCYERLKRYEEAVADYQAAILSNRQYPAPNFRLGVVAARMGLYDQAMLSLAMGAWLSPAEAAENGYVSFLERISDGSEELEKLSQTIVNSDPYADYNEFFANKTALQSNYKVKQTLKTSFGRQLDLFLKNNKYDKNSTDFWNTTYMEFFSRIYDEGKLDQLVMVSVSSVNSDEIQAKLKSKISKLTDFYVWSKTMFSDVVSYSYMTFEGKKQWVNTTYSNGLKSIGRVENGKQIGTHYNYYPNGQLMLVARLDENGDSNGEWDIYAENGKRSKSLLVLNKEGTEQEIKEYYESGELQYKYKKVNGVITGTVYEYYRNGNVRLEYSVSGDKKNGPFTTYFPNKTIAEQKNFKDDVLEGVYKSWHANGLPEDEVMVKNGLLTGKRSMYYENGQLSSEKTYKEDLAEGPYTEYFPNGQISEQGNYKKGSYSGTTKAYYSNGKLSSEAVFDESGKENGTSLWYDTDEKKYQRLHFSKGNLEKIEYIDKAGAESVLAEQKGKKFDLQYSYPDGKPKTEGSIQSSAKNGTWKYYDRYGLIVKKETYKAGIPVDTVFEYFPTGGLYKSYVIKDGNYDGLFLEYNIFGDLVQEGMYRNDQLSDDWYIYREDGTISSHHFYANGVRHGYQTEYTPSGKVRSVTLMDNGNIVFDRNLDTAGAVLNEAGVFNGEVKIQSINRKFNRMVGNYIDGNAEGHFIYYTSRGTIDTEGDYVNDNKNGIWKTYYPNGKIKLETSYLNGKLNGKRIKYYPNGKMESVINYVLDNAQGEMTLYHENGQKRLYGQFLDDERHGKYYSYGQKGEVFFIRNYDRGVIVSYTYLDANGNEKPPVVITGNEMNVVTYYPSGKKGLEHKKVNGLLEGTYINYHENGQKAEVETYLHDELNGKSTTYNDAGVKLSEEDYVKGSLHGWSVEYYTNGKVKSKTPYLYGSLNGMASEYSADGKLIRETYYFDNDEIEVKTY